MKKKNWITIILVFFIVLTVYLSNIVIDYKKDLNTNTFRNLLTTHDVVPNNLLSYQIIRYKSFNFYPIRETLNDIRPKENYNFFFTIKKDNTTLYSSFPIISGLLALPLTYLPILLGWVQDLENARQIDIIKMMFLARVSASFLTAISCVLFYKILEIKYPKNKIIIYLLTAFFSFGTLLWSISSRGLSQHTASVLFITLVLFLFYINDFKYKNFLIGIFTGLSVLSRYSSMFFAIPVFVYYLIFRKKKTLEMISGALPIALLLFSINYLFYGRFLITGYSARNDVSFSTPLLEGLFGLLFSFGKGLLFVMPPLFIATVYGIYSLFKKEYWKKYSFENILFIGYIGNLIFFSKWYSWYGGDTFGPRMLIEFVPLLTLLLARLLVKEFKKKYLWVFVFLIIYSVFIQFNAVFYKMSRCHPRDAWTTNCLSPPSKISDYFNSDVTFYDPNKSLNVK